ncbi:MAG: RDD family protein [Betaproteobacteria bacterium]|nr:MAG: RDD family protein [Betaproteobacteria bacterium]TMG76305.1 MAG: RDD family protein [Betaproteobacteria bacterium]
MSSGARALRIPRGPSIGRRLLSVFYESLVVFAIIFFAGLAFYGAANGRLSGGTRHALQLYLFLVLGIYFVACWSRGGQTLPMQTWKLRLVRGENLPVGAGRALLRYALAWPSLLLLGGGFLWAFLDRDRQFLHDRLAGTRIVTSETGKREG